MRVNVKSIPKVTVAAVEKFVALSVNAFDPVETNDPTTGK